MAIAVLAQPGSASANGLEIIGSGSRAQGRGGAFAARADDPMALLYNPAMLADVPSHQAFVNLHVLNWNGCFQRTGSNMAEGYPPGSTQTRLTVPRMGDPTTWTDDPYVQVCNNALPTIAPQFGVTLRIIPELAIAAGLVGGLGVGGVRYGDSGTVTYTDADGMPVVAPSPVRYAVGEQNAQILYPAIGFGVRPVEWLRLGMTFMWGFALINNTSYSSGLGYNPDLDTRTRLSVTDWFIPSIVLSTHIQPHPNLDVMLFARLTDAIGGVVNTTDATLRLDQRPFAPLDATEMCPGPDNMLGTADDFTCPSARQVAEFPATFYYPQPYFFGFGLRYAHRIRPRPWENGFEAAVRGVVDDGMFSEAFDIEFDFTYEYNSHIRDIQVGIVPDPSRSTCTGTMTAPGLSGRCARVSGLPAELSAYNPIPRGLADAVQLKLGSDINAVPGVLAVRAGVNADIPLWQTPYMTVDLINGLRIGLNVGATVRIERVDISLAYSHIFQLDRTITNGQLRGIAQVGGMGGACSTMAGDPDNIYDPNNPVTSRGCYPAGYGGVINNGDYSASFDIVSASVTYHLPD